ncbi:MAG: DUF2877 domain-containing protein [Candidatus Cloacimonetes bacterium]|nr:DUF2877 domain-containing protein [Candidatus Cloacimonadota bacterium]
MPLKAKVLSIGSGIPQGTFTDIFSRHAKAINFIWQRQVISLCSKALCPGHYRIILDCEELSQVHSIAIIDDLIKINGDVLSRKSCSHYQAPVFGEALDNPLLLQQLQNCRDTLSEQWPPLCVGALLSSGSEPQHGFDLALSIKYNEGLKHLADGEFSKAIRCFKGKGYGLTPGGDDFLAGLTLGLAYRQRVEKKSLSEILDLLLFESLSENYLANTFLRQAYDLQPDQDWTDFLLALETSGDVTRAMQRICGQGATSGYDALCGFFAAWEMI